MSGPSGRIEAGRFWATRLDPAPAAPDRSDATRDHVVEALHGAALDLSNGPDDIRIALVDRGGATAMVLGPFDETDAVAQWRSLALSSGLVPMLRMSSGEVEALASQIGRLRVGPARARRLHGMRRRRPRFLARRKSSRLPSLPLVFREPEIAGGAGA